MIRGLQQLRFPYMDCALGVAQAGFGFEVRSSEAIGFTSFTASGEAACFTVPCDEAPKPLVSLASGLQANPLASKSQAKFEALKLLASLASELQVKPLALKLRAELRSHWFHLL